MQPIRVIAVVGPTAVGKTAFGIKLAQEVGGEVISADSRQVYKGLDIGTGKVTQEEMNGVPHHLIDVADPRVQFNVSDFVELGRKAITDISRRGKVPIIVGGTGMYIDSLVGRMGMSNAKPDPILRARLETASLGELQDELQKLDPERFKNIDQKNPRRLVRAIEVAHSGVATNAQQEKLYEVQWIGITLPREELRERIIKRLKDRLGAGMLDEAKRLHAEGLSYERMDALGLEYRAMAKHLQGEISYEEMIALLEIEIYKYAKRQMTWFKTNPDIKWQAP
jgi:tRNA dimethylallyltransferase